MELSNEAFRSVKGLWGKQTDCKPCKTYSGSVTCLDSISWELCSWSCMYEISRCCLSQICQQKLNNKKTRFENCILLLAYLRPTILGEKINKIKGPNEEEHGSNKLAIPFPRAQFILYSKSFFWHKVEAAILWKKSLFVPVEDFEVLNPFALV